MLFLSTSCMSVTENDTEASSVYFTSKPNKEIDHNRLYTYSFSAESENADSTISYSVLKPDWLEFDTERNRLTGTAGWQNLNKKPTITITASDGVDEASQRFTISVNLGEIICNQPFGDPDSSEYILPYLKGKTYRVIQSYCPSNPNWGHRNWFAYDFGTSIGDTIIASRSGGVIAVRENNPNVGDCSGGKENFVFVLHDDGTVMQYVHLSTNSVFVNQGDTIQQGQIIALAGNSGCSSGPHTHVALFKDHTNYDRQSTIPFNFNNADGTLDSNNGLIYNIWYTAL